ncbi:magnesium transporter MgtE N-terminal domain-containing protein [Candidatus Margulisiibacteriota bacterium]
MKIMDAELEGIHGTPFDEGDHLSGLFQNIDRHENDVLQAQKDVRDTNLINKQRLERAAAPLQEIETRDSTTNVFELIQSMSPEGAASIINRLCPLRALKVLKKLPIRQAVQILMKLAPEMAAAIIEQLPLNAQATLISKMPPGIAAAIIKLLPANVAAEILKKQAISNTLQILDLLPPGKAAAILTEFTAKKAVAVLNVLPPEKAEDIMYKMADNPCDKTLAIWDYIEEDPEHKAAHLIDDIYDHASSKPLAQTG